MSKTSQGDGWQSRHIVNLNATKVEVQAKQCIFGGVRVENNQAAAAWIQVFNLPAASVTLGTTVPDWEFLCPANGNILMAIPDGVRHDSGLTCASTTTGGGSTASAT